MTDTTREAVARAICRRIYSYSETDSVVDENWQDFLIFADAAIAALRPAQDAERVVHLKRGSTYEVIGEAEVQCAVMVEEGAMLTVYRCEKDGKLWARPTAEFRDGRFAASPPRSGESPKVDPTQFIGGDSK